MGNAKTVSGQAGEIARWAVMGWGSCKGQEGSCKRQKECPACQHAVLVDSDLRLESPMLNHPAARRNLGCFPVSEQSRAVAIESGSC